MTFAPTPRALILSCVVALVACRSDEQLRGQVPEELMSICEPTPEICDGQDNDCDGAVDNGLVPMTCGVGECAQVVSSCNSGTPQACPASLGTVEICDGLDNDCDGTVDEDLLANVSRDLRVSPNAQAADYVYAAWTGSTFGVVWLDRRDGDKQNGEIYFASLDSRASRLSTNDVRLTNTTELSTHPAIAFGKDRFGVAWTEGLNADAEIYFRPLNENGQPAASATRLTQANGKSDWPDIAWNGEAFGVVWVDGRNGRDDLYFRLVGADGTPLGMERQLTTDPEHQQTPILKWTGKEFGLAWTDYRDGSRQVYFRRLSANGERIGEEIRVSQSRDDASWPDLTWSDNGWALVWAESRGQSSQVFMQRLDVEGRLVGQPTRVTDATSKASYPSVDWNGYQYGLSWQDEREGTPSIYFAAVNREGVKNGKDLLISTGRRDSMYTTALWNGTTFAFSWRDNRDSSSQVYFAYVGCPVGN